MSIRTRMILAFAGIALLASALGFALSYTTTRRYFLEQTRGHLMHLASTMAAALDGNALRSLTVLDARNAAYEAEKDKLRRFYRAVPEAKVAYFYRPTTDRPGVMELVVDALEPGDPDAITADPKDRYYDTNENPAPEMTAGLQKPTADAEPTSDNLGIWLSGYAPVLASDGKVVGAFGLDLPAKHLQEEEQQLLTLLGLSALASLVAALLIGFLLARAIARPIQELAEATHQIAGGDLSARVKVDRKDEIGALGRDFNKMVGNLGAMAESLQRYTTDALESHEENMALQLQKVLLPAGDLKHGDVHVSGTLQPVAWGGGDTYQHFLFGDGAYLMLSYGHVRASGLLACSLVTLVQSRLGILVSDLVLRPAEVLAELSKTMIAAAPGLAVMDYLCAVYDLQKRWLSVGSAGQVVVVLQRPSTGDLQQLGTSAGPPLGQASDGSAVRYGDMDLDLERGDRLIACSMVAIDLKNAKGEAFGIERLEDALRRHAGLAAEPLREALLSEMTSFAVGGAIEDDLTVLVAEFGASGAGSERE